MSHASETNKAANKGIHGCKTWRVVLHSQEFRETETDYEARGALNRGRERERERERDWLVGVGKIIVSA